MPPQNAPGADRARDGKRAAATERGETAASRTAAPVPIRQRQRQQTRDILFEVALAEIAEHGLAGVRIEHIARKSGVTRPTVYAHFPTREDFLREMQARSEEHALRFLRERLAADAEPRGADLFHTLVDGLFDMAAATHEKLRRESFAQMLRSPGADRWLGDRLFAYLVECTAAGQAGGELPNEHSAEDLTRIVMTALFAFIAVEGTSEAARRRDAHQLLDGLLGRTARSEGSTR